MCPLILVICFRLPVCPSGLGWNHQQYPPSALFMWTMTSTELRARCWDKGSRQTGLWQRSRGENMVDGAIWPALLRPRSAEHKAGATCLVCCAIQQKLSTTRIVRQDNVCVCVCVCVCVGVCVSVCVSTFHHVLFYRKYPQAGEKNFSWESCSLFTSLCCF